MRAIASLLVISLLLAGGSARADDPRKSEADALYADARSLHDHDHHLESLQKFEQSYKVYPSPNTLVAVAREEQLLKRNIASIRHLREALKQPLLSPKNVPAARQHLAELRALVGRLDVQGPAGATVDVAGTSLRLPLDEPLDVEPGPLSLTGENQGVRYTASATAVADTTVIATLLAMQTTAPQEPAANLPRPEPSMPPHDEKRTWTTGKTLGVALGGAAIVAVGIGIGMRISASSKGDDATSAARDPGAASGCLGASTSACDRVRADAESERGRKNAATALFVGGAGLAVVGLASFFFWPSRASNTAAITILPAIAAGSGGLIATGNF